MINFLPKYLNQSKAILKCWGIFLLDKISFLFTKWVIYHKIFYHSWCQRVKFVNLCLNSLILILLFLVLAHIVNLLSWDSKKLQIFLLQSNCSFTKYFMAQNLRRSFYYYLSNFFFLWKIFDVKKIFFFFFISFY